MIKYIKRSELDDVKYDACIKNALNTRIFAYSWYLDIVATNWDALVLNDYETVMPLPWRSKYFIKYIYPPSWTQQLGVFSGKNIDAELVQKFIKSIPKKFKKITIQFNSDNPIAGKNVIEKLNYILDLNYSYDTLFNNYRRDRKKNIKKAVESELIFDNQVNILNLINLYQESFRDLNFDENLFAQIKHLMEYCLSNEFGFQRNVYFKNRIIAGAFFLRYQDRIYYVFGCSNSEGKNYGATTFLIDSVIKEHSRSHIIFDFEGSSVSSIGSFYKSFGTKNEGYYLFQKRTLLN